MASVTCQGPKQAKVTDPSLFLATLTPLPGAGSYCGPGLLFSTWATWHPRVPRHGCLFLLNLFPAFWETSPDTSPLSPHELMHG